MFDCKNYNNVLNTQVTTSTRDCLQSLENLSDDFLGRQANASCSAAASMLS